MDNNKKEFMDLFEKYYDEIMSKDLSQIYEISSIIKNRVLDLGDKVLENWTGDKVVSNNNENIITKYNDKKK